MITKKLCGIFFIVVLSTTLKGLDFDFEEFRSNCPAFPPKEVCEKSAQQLWKIQQKLDTCCTELDLKFETLQGEVERIFGCVEPTSISTNTFTITEPGNYCLTADIVGPITINASNVILDLNNHSLGNAASAVSVMNQSNIIIRNGKIENTSTIAIGASNVTSLVIENIDFDGFQRANDFSMVDGFVIRNCTFVNGLRSINIGTSNNGVIRSCLCYRLGSTTDTIFNSSFFMSNCNNIITYDLIIDSYFYSQIAARTLAVQISTNLIFSNVIISRSTGPNQEPMRFQSCDSLVIDRCQCINNGDGGTNFLSAFFSFGSNNVIFNSCFASGNTSLNDGHGFVVQGQNNCILNCVAKENSGAGFLSSSASNCYFFKNIAIANGTDGFFRAGGSNVGFFSNYAANNPSNYGGIPTGNITVWDSGANAFETQAGAPKTAVAWNNIEAKPTNP